MLVWQVSLDLDLIFTVQYIHAMSYDLRVICTENLTEIRLTRWLIYLPDFCVCPSLAPKL